MATLNKPVGYENEFVDQVPEDYFCNLCKHVARQYTITTCCGECFCKVCIDTIVKDKKSCPSCKSNDIKALGLQVKYQRKILALEVRCTMKDRGCEWTGQLQHLDAHLEVTTGNCQYVDVKCPKKCDQKVQKRNVDTHLANECPNRDYRCPHCNFKNKFQVVSEHFEVCPYYPLACSNRCGASFERNDLEDHMKMCRLEEVQCVFSNEGCQAKFIRENEDKHMDQNTQKHLALIPAATLRISQEQQVLKEQLKDKDTEIEMLKAVNQELQLQVNSLNLHIGIPPYYITFNNLQMSAIESQPMYTHPGGYRFSLKLWPKGADLHSGTHVSVRIYSLNSDHDDSLNFPAKFNITIQLLNQHKDQEHPSRDIQCEITTRGKIGYYKNIGADDSFIPHSELEWNRYKHTKCLKKDCFKFRITKIVMY